MTLLNKPTFIQKYQSTANRERVVSVLEMFDGLALASDESNMNLIFQVCAPHFENFVKLLDLYHNFLDVQLYILVFFRDLVKCQVNAVDLVFGCHAPRP